MGTLDRVVDRLRRDDDRPDYVCRNCETAFDVQHHVCPECDGYSVEHADW